MAELNILIRKRGGLKHRLTSFQTYLSKIQSQVDLFNPIEVNERILKVKTLFLEYCEIQSKIEEICDENTLVEEYNERENFDTNYFESMSTATMLINSRVQSVQSNNSNSSMTGSKWNSAVKLPAIQLATFNGSYETWVEFRDMFRSVIHENMEINNVQKLHYLKSCLQGQALQIIKSLTISDSNYEVAWELLCRRYDNKKLLVNTHVKSLFNLVPVKGEFATELRNLTDTFLKCYLSLQALGQPVEHWGTLLIYIISTKLDAQTKREWENHTLDEEFPSVESLQIFLKNKCVLLETLQIDKPVNVRISNKCFKGDDARPPITTMVTASDKTRCTFCDKNGHLIYVCESFLKLNTLNRTIEVKNKKLCINCLRKGHFSYECRSGKCKICQKSHHTLLHYVKTIQNTSNETAQNTVVSNYGFTKNEQVLLSTAIVIIRDKLGNDRYCRALLDSGSESTFITTELCNELQLKKTEIQLSIAGINQTLSSIRYKTEFELRSCQSSYKRNVNCYVIDKITESLPAISIDTSKLNIPSKIKLADSEFYKRSKIELLIGANLFWELISSQRIKLGKGQPILQKTMLGWILGGPFSYKTPEKGTINCNLNTNSEVQDQLKSFWELEEIQEKTIMSSDDIYCEEHFIETTQRDDKGRFIVSIPLKQPTPSLGDSLNIATKRFYNLERKLEREPELKKLYMEFLTEYEDLGHMTKLATSQEKVENSFYLPHHGVLKETNVTTKLRVVFDGSCKSSNGVSLNEIQHVGPVIQEELFSILIRFRKHEIIVCADIEKMYRQILINPQQRPLQQILWRPNQADDLRTYQLNTVTYGTASAPYLAIRCLKQVAIDNREIKPKAAEVILSDFYVDDLLTGGETTDEVINLANDITKLLGSVGFMLHKWKSNNAIVIQAMEGSKAMSHNKHFFDNTYNKTLGLYWSNITDTLRYNIREPGTIKIITKRVLLSDIAQIFDPLGLLGPCIITTKILLQKLWLEKLSWDDPIPNDVATEWKLIRQKLLSLNEIRIPRKIFCKNAKRIELHGFADASQSAYGACIYTRSINAEGEINVHLVCSKTRVAPLKLVTIPRLELCAAVLLSELFVKVQKSLNMQVDECFLWSDSTVTLHWLNTSSHRLQTFVGNRVQKIQMITNITNWRHIQSEHNPADILSRGVSPNALEKNQMWWHGPVWLRQNSETWPQPTITFNEEPLELRKTSHTCTTTNNDSSLIFTRFSSYSKLLRVTAYCLRFISNCKAKNIDRTTGHLSVLELEKALTCIIKIAQSDSFSPEINIIRKGKLLSVQLQKLHPFVDDEGIIRVGGRLQLSQFHYNKKHPILISGKHVLSKLIFKHEHLRLLHAGPQLLLASVRERFWPTAGRCISKKTVFECIKCYRAKPLQTNQIMGNLPKNRLTAKYPFFATGVDYAGPLTVKERLGRGAKYYKCYVCLFICLSIKAIHLEPVTELSTKAFIATFRRFIARRGKPSFMYSDNGTNFVGAATELKDLGNFLIRENQNLYDFMSNEGIKWEFIPANSPHFGGLWEAGVKSIKYHLKRILCNALITFEELLTTLTQIEAVLNSRPLCPLSSSPDDFDALSPAHFLIGRPATALPDPHLIDVPINRLSRYQHSQQLMQHFWKKWSMEYVAELQQRSKWLKRLANVNKGDLVILKENNVPPLKWKLGRVTDIHPGMDGVVRVVSIKTSSGVVLKRAITKICVLPVEGDSADK